MPFSLDRPLEDDNLKRQREADEAKRSQATYDEAQKGQSRMTFADQGPQAPVIPAGATIPKPALNTYNDAQIFADFPNAVGVVRAMNGTWTMPLILGGLDKVPVVEMPEAVEFVKSLSGGNPVIQIPASAVRSGLSAPTGKASSLCTPTSLKTVEKPRRC